MSDVVKCSWVHERKKQQATVQHNLIVGNNVHQQELRAQEGVQREQLWGNLK